FPPTGTLRLHPSPSPLPRCACRWSNMPTPAARFTWPASGQSDNPMNELLPLMLEGAWVTVQVTFFGSLLAIAVALVAAFGRLSPIAPLRWLAISYIEVFRGSSLLVQLFWLYFVLPMPPFNVSLSAFQVAVIGLGLNIGAYGAEVLRGAIRSVHEGQYEACQALNMTPWQ